VALSGATNRTGTQPLNAGDVLSATVQFSKPVFYNPDTGTLKLRLVIGSQTVEADYASGSGSAALEFHYTVAAGDNDADGVSVLANALVLSGSPASLQDAAGNVALLPHGAVSSNASYRVDTAAPLAGVVPWARCRADSPGLNSCWTGRVFIA
jgi:hypothetical protein